MSLTERKKPTTKVKVTLEAWYDGVLAYADDHQAESAQVLRDLMCSKTNGWEHFVDEGVPAARKHRAVFLFVQEEKAKKPDRARCCHGYRRGTPAGDLHRGCAREGTV